MAKTSPALCLRGGELVKGLGRAVREGLSLRAQHLGTIEALFPEMSEALDGYHAVHKDVERSLRICQDLLRALHQAAQPFGQFDLPPPTPEQMEQRRGWVRWDAIRPSKPAEAQNKWAESEYAKKQREERNAAWREDLEAQRGRGGSTLPEGNSDYEDEDEE